MKAAAGAKGRAVRLIIFKKMKFSSLFSSILFGGLVFIAPPTFAGKGSPAYLEFSSSQYIVNGAAPQAEVTVTRSNNLTEPVSVTFGTSDGSARAGVDYVSTHGTLLFGVGETTKNFSVSLVGNQKIGAAKTVNLTISAANYSGLITRGSATLRMQ